MGHQEPELEAREAAITALLARHPDAIVAAMADDGHRIPLPDSLTLDGHQALALGKERETMLHVIEPGDRFSVVAAWESAHKHGVSVAGVHVVGSPETRLNMTIIDARALHGAWLALLTREDEASDDGPVPLAGPALEPVRPRRATMHKSMTAVMTQIDENVTKMLGWTADDLVGRRSSEFMHPEDQDRALSAWMQLLSTGMSQRVRVRHQCADGTWLWVEIENIHNGVDDAEEVDVITEISDVSDEMASHEAVRQREQLFSRLAEALPTGVLQLRHDGSVVYANARLNAILHSEPPTDGNDLLANVVEADRAAVRAAIRSALVDGVDSELEVDVVIPSGLPRRRCGLTVVAVEDNEGETGALVCVSDVTESAELREQLRVQATHDPLTGLLNRSAVLDALEELLANPERPEIVAVFLDIDNFKPVNDRYGHAAGDQVLMHVARRLSRLCREQDLVARLGGDEFLLVFQGRHPMSDFADLAGRVREVLRHPIALDGAVVEVQASVGVAGRDGETTVEALVSRADAAMYECKRQRAAAPTSLRDVTGPSRKTAAG